MVISDTIMSRHLFIFWICFNTVTLTGCSLPAIKETPESVYLPHHEAASTRLGRSITPVVAQHPELSGFYPLNHSLDAFASRMLLIAAADKTLDVQYYIWRRDLTGLLLLQALYEAAERGVRVRLLLDDNGTSGLDDILTNLNNHPNIQVKLFNPFTNRQVKISRFLWDFRLANRRMHNKSIIADNSAAIVGGRNIGNEYFGADDGFLFNDLDVLAIGAVINETSADFDRYWNFQLSYPVNQIIDSDSEALSGQLSDDLKKITTNPASQHYMKAVENSALVKKLINQEEFLYWSKIELVSDDPEKITNSSIPKQYLLFQMNNIIGHPRHRLDIASPYFVPGKKGLKHLTELRQQGIDIRILTNAREATDVIAVHSGYARYRKPLLQAGIQLYEMQREPTAAMQPETSRLFGSSATSLHAKTFAIDGQRVFIGSFNFDPRSALLNTEMGYIIHSSELANSIHKTFTDQVPAESYRLTLSADEKLRWQQADGMVYQREPGSSFSGDLLLNILSVLPIEGLL